METELGDRWTEAVVEVLPWASDGDGERARREFEVDPGLHLVAVLDRWGHPVGFMDRRVGAVRRRAQVVTASSGSPPSLRRGR